MIFKLTFGNTFRTTANQNIYISLCESKFSLSPRVFKLCLYRALAARVGLNHDYNLFTYDFPPSLNGHHIKCYVRLNDKGKLFCKLEQLMPYIAPVSVKVGSFYRVENTVQVDYAHEPVVNVQLPHVEIAAANNPIGTLNFEYAEYGNNGWEVARLVEPETINE